MSSRTMLRLKNEWTKYGKERPPGVNYWPLSESDLTLCEGTISGPEGSPYAEGTFHLSISIPNRYPMELPFMRFKTPVYHPNIDNEGRICLDILKMPPNVSWKPHLSIVQVLMHLQVLLSDPNPDDPLMDDIAQQFRSDKEGSNAKARASTLQHATNKKKLPETSGLLEETVEPEAKRMKPS